MTEDRGQKRKKVGSWEGGMTGSGKSECGMRKRKKVRRWEKGKVEKKEGGKKSEVGMSRLRIADLKGKGF
jgi:hypothetical protein